MDPNLFHLDWERVSEALLFIVVLSFLVERALAVVFESSLFLGRAWPSGTKESIAIVLAVVVCWSWQFDAVGMIILAETTRPEGYLLTGLVVAGGSKASIKLFHDVLGVQSSAHKRRHEASSEQALAKVAAAVEATQTSPQDAAARDKAIASANAAELEIAKIEEVTRRQPYTTRLAALKSAIPALP